MTIQSNHIVGQVVADDYRAASVFKKHKVDFCCKGNRSISEVCNKQNIDEDKLLNELNRISEVSGDEDIDFNAWDLDLLADYIEKKHHRYVRNRIPELKAYLNKIAKVHGERHPELHQVESLFTGSAEDLLQHMEKEEKILFPIVREISEQAGTAGTDQKSVVAPIKVMMEEHDNEGERFRQIAALTDDYTPPQDACTTYEVAFKMLSEFEADLHKHIHLENNILFPKVLETEKSYSHA